MNIVKTLNETLEGCRFQSSEITTMINVSKINKYWTKTKYNKASA